MQTHFTYEAFLQWWGGFFWPFVRVSAMMAIVPILSARTISVRFKLIIAVIITAAIAPAIRLDHPIDPFTNEGLWMAVEQAGIGLAMGLAFVIVFQAVTLAGQMIANGMGLGFASMVDPTTGMNAPVISQFYIIIVSLLFITFDGHLLLIRLLSDSFVTMPLSGYFLSTASLKELVSAGSYIFSWGMVMSLPIVTALLLANIALGLISRAAPTLNVFSIGFVVTILGGAVLMWWLLPMLVGQFNQYINMAVDMVHHFTLNKP